MAPQLRVRELVALLLAVVVLPLAALLVPGVAVAPAHADNMATISGTVSQPRAGGYYGSVQVFAVNSGVVATQPTTTVDANGGPYTATVPPGSYVVGFSVETTDEYGTQYYNGVTSPAAATVIDLDAGESVSHIDATLQFDPSKGEISGTVTDGHGGTYTGNVSLYKDGPGGPTLAASTFCYLGQFSRYVDPGSYQVVYGADPDDPYATTYYPGTTDQADATDVTVTAGGSTDASATLSADPTIASVGGTVTVPDGSGRYSGNATLTWQGSDPADHPALSVYVGNGTFERTLRPGTYLLGFSIGDADGYADQYYDHKPTAAGATLITVAAGQHLTGLDGDLEIDQSNGHIAGTVTAGGSPYDGTVAFYRQDDDGDSVADYTASVVSGSYNRALPPGHYKVGFDPSGTGGYDAGYYPAATTLAAGGTVTVTAGATTSGIDGTLTAAGQVPDAPSDVTATAGDTSATVSWSAPDDHGSTLTGYTVTASPGGASKVVDASHTSTTMTGLSNGTAYTFTVTATNGVGTSVASDPSAAVTPSAPPATITAWSLHGLPRHPHHSVRYRVTVTLAAGDTAVTGPVTIKAGSRVVGKGTLHHGTAKIRLAKLHRGQARIRIVYAGSATVERFTSPARVVTVRPRLQLP